MPVKLVDAAVTNLMGINVAEAKNTNEQGNKEFSNSFWIIVGLAGFAVLLASLIAIILIRGITRPINKVKKALAENGSWRFDGKSQH